MKMLLWLALVLVRFTKLLVILKTSWFCRKYSKPQKENIKKPSEKMPENPDSKEKSHPLGVVRLLDTEHDGKRINAFGLSGKKLWLFECY